MKKYFQAPWTLKDTLIIFVTAIILLLIATFALEYLSLEELIADSNKKSLFLLGIFITQWLLILIPLLALTAIKYRAKAEHFGFKKVGFLKTLGYVLQGYLIYIAVSIIITILILYTEIKIPGYQIQEKLLPLFGDSTWELLLAGGIIIVLAPIIEEIFFRGFLLRSLANKIGLFYGSAIAALIFAIFHLQPTNIIPIFILGLIINSIVIRSQSIVPAIAFHMFNNSIAFTIEVLILKEVISIENLV